MQDIDFDEIDRAVSSATTPSEIPSEPVVVKSVQTSTPVAPAARRSSGRFMDVVHTSSDMRPAARPSALVAPNPPSSLKETVAPIVVPEQEAPVVDADTAFHWPDPIDLHEETKPEEPAVPVVETPTKPEEISSPVEEAEEGTAPLESPFLSDAKVEKRPLGAFSDAAPDLLTPEDFPSSQTQTPESEPESEPEPTPEVETPQNHEEPAEVPAELHEDLLKLETPTKDEPVENHETPTPAPEDVPTGPTSITQQYKEQPSNANEPSGAIFDTEVYNQALVHTPKKSKKMLIVVWIAALILVGGGIGTGIYFVVLPMLH